MTSESRSGAGPEVSDAGRVVVGVKRSLWVATMATAALLNCHGVFRSSDRLEPWLGIIGFWCCIYSATSALTGPDGTPFAKRKQSLSQGPDA